MDANAADRQGPSDTKLVAAVLRGELAAFDQLLRRYQRQATATAYRLLNNTDDAMEVVQDSFLKAFERLGTLSRRERFGPWLLRIVANSALNRRRGRALRQTASLERMADRGDDRPESGRRDPHAATPAQLASAAELRGIIDEAIGRLPRVQALALLLFTKADMPQKKIAEILGCSVEAVKWHVFTARKKLKEILADYI